MTEHSVTFDIAAQPVRVPTGTLLSEAARLAGVDIGQPCGGQGRCGRCAVQVTSGDVRRRSSLRLSAEDIAQGYALACQSVIEGDLSITVPPQEKIERRLTTDRTAIEVSIPIDYDPIYVQTIRRINLRLAPPRMDDQTDDWSRLKTALRQKTGIEDIGISLNLLQKLGNILRENDWQVTVITDAHVELDGQRTDERLVALIPDQVPIDDPLYGIAVDIGTTTVTVWLVDLISGKVEAQASEYNGQISRGEDVISRIIYSGKNGGREELQNRVLETINKLVNQTCKHAKARPQDIVKATVAGNSTMTHLFLGIPAASIRLSPFITAVNQPPIVTAGSIGLAINSEATVDCLPGVASYVGADISSGVLASRMDETEKLTLFLDVGTNGETVLGSREWLVTCACSAGPAFEGAGVLFGMRATRGAIEECWISGENSPHPYEPTYRVIGNGKPRGICGSGLISLLAEMFLTGVVDKGGMINLSLVGTNPRIREGEHGPEYVIAWGNQVENGKDISINNVDIDNLKRAKAAIYAGFTVLAQSVGVPLDMVEQILIGGSFGKYINVEKAVQIGLLPDMPWDRFKFLGNTSVQGAYLALLDWRNRDRIRDIASQMTYIELSADNTFYDAFMSAMFLPHTDLASFPSVAAAIEKKTITQTSET
ncbi:MAG: ferredoxin [Anaerolineales bacterium]|nr:MAG: ferredoxin [Anaerolineales bacterium]